MEQLSQCIVCNGPSKLTCFCKLVHYCGHVCRKKYENQHKQICYSVQRQNKQADKNIQPINKLVQDDDDLSDLSSFLQTNNVVKGQCMLCSQDSTICCQYCKQVFFCSENHQKLCLNVHDKKSCIELQKKAGIYNKKLGHQKQPSNIHQNNDIQNISIDNQKQKTKIMVQPQCAKCGKKTIKNCTCQTYSYCSQKCREEYYISHKEECAQLVKMRSQMKKEETSSTNISFTQNSQNASHIISQQNSLNNSYLLNQMNNSLQNIQKNNTPIQQNILQQQQQNWQAQQANILQNLHNKQMQFGAQQNQKDDGKGMIEEIKKILKDNTSIIHEQINKKECKEKNLKIIHSKNKNGYDELVQIHDHYYGNLIKSLIAHQGFFFKQGSSKQFPKLYEELQNFTFNLQINSQQNLNLRKMAIQLEAEIPMDQRVIEIKFQKQLKAQFRIEYYLKEIRDKFRHYFNILISNNDSQDNAKLTLSIDSKNLTQVMCRYLVLVGNEDEKTIKEKIKQNLLDQLTAINALTSEINLIEIDLFDQNDIVDGENNKQLKEQLKEFIGQQFNDQIYRQFKDHILQEAQASNCIEEMAEQLKDVQIQQNLVFKCLKRQETFCANLVVAFKQFITEKFYVSKCLIESFLKHYQKDFSNIQIKHFDIIYKFLESEYHLYNLGGQNSFSLKNICVILSGKYKEKKDLQLIQSQQNLDENQAPKKNHLDVDNRILDLIIDNKNMRLFLNVNFNEYTKSIKIMNILFGSTIESLKQKNLLENLDFILCGQLKQYDTKLKINERCKFLKNNISIQELLEKKFNVKIFTSPNDPPIIVGFKKQIGLAGKYYNELLATQEILIEQSEVGNFDVVRQNMYKIKQFENQNSVEIQIHQNQIQINGYEISKGHLDSVKQNLILMIKNINEQLQTVTVIIPRPQIINSQNQTFNHDKKNSPLINILTNNEFNKQYINQILQDNKSVKIDSQNFLQIGLDQDEIFEIQGPMQVIKHVQKYIENFINNCLKREIFQITVKDQKLIRNIKKYEKENELEANFNCLILKEFVDARPNRNQDNDQNSDDDTECVWAYEVTPNDSNYNQKQVCDISQKEFVFFDKDQSDEIEQFYQQHEKYNNQSFLQKITSQKVSQEFQLSQQPNSQWSYTIQNNDTKSNNASTQNSSYIQVNIQTRKCRNIFRLQIQKSDLNGSQLSLNKKAKYIHKNVNQTLNLIIYGEKDRIIGIKGLETYLKEKYKEIDQDINLNEINLNEYKYVCQMNQQELVNAVNYLQKLCYNDYQCKITGIFNQKENIMKISIQKSSKSEDAKHFIRTQFNLLEFSQYPPFWKNVIEVNIQKLVKLDVKPSDEAFGFIQQNMRKTLPNAKILKIKLLMNQFLWNSFKIGIEQLKQRQVNDNMKYLWHGTRVSDPKLFYEGEEGFDIKYSNDGMWGRGLYFAENASYSLGYSHNHKNGVKGMFFAYVNLGNCKDLPPKKDLKEPPQGYDSVTGQTGGSQVYIVYANKKAYPQYYVKYLQ